MAVMATAAPAPITDDPHAIRIINAGPFNAATLVASASYTFFTIPADDYYDIIAIYASLEAVASSASNLQLTKADLTTLMSSGTAMGTLILTATDFTAGTLHNCAEKLTASTLVGLAPGTRIGAVANATATTGLVGLSFTYVLRKSGFRTTDNGGKFYPVPSPNNF